MAHPVITISDNGGPNYVPRRTWLDGRRLPVAGAIAAAEVLAYLVVRPPRIIGLLFFAVLLVACIMLSSRLRPGLTRDLVIVAGFAQAFLLAVPIIFGLVTLFVASVIVFALIAAVVMLGLRLRR